MVQEISDLRREIASLCEALRVEQLHLFGSAAQESTLAEVRDLDFLVQFKPMPPAEYAQNYFLLIERNKHSILYLEVGKRLLIY